MEIGFDSICWENPERGLIISLTGSAKFPLKNGVSEMLIPDELIPKNEETPFACGFQVDFRTIEIWFWDAPFKGIESGIYRGAGV